MSAESIKTAADAAHDAVTVWHGFAIIGGILTGLFVLWAMFDTRKSQ